MTHFQIKVCGITRVADAVLAANLGADMIGMVFCDNSVRNISITRAREITDELPAVVDAVGVFVDADTESVLRIAERCRLRMAQWHGRCRTADISRLQRAGLMVIQAYRIGDRREWSVVAHSKADLVMIDNSRGTGVRFDSELVPSKEVPNLVLSGGVSSRNVAEGVASFRPVVVDVNSSVETKPGIKSRYRLKAFFRACNELRYGQ